MEERLDKIRNQLKEIIDGYPLSYLQYAQMIGISPHTLIHFLKAVKIPNRMTLWKIELFVDSKRRI